MKIGINASFLRKQNTGIGQVTVNFLEKIAETHQNAHEYFIYLEEDIEFPLLGSFRKRVVTSKHWKRDDLVRKFLWEKWLLPRQIKKDGCEVVISLYQCPMVLPKEVKHIMIAHDLIPQFFPEYLNNWRKKLYWFFTKRGIKTADRIVAVSHRTEKDVASTLGIDPAHIAVALIDVAEIFKKQVSQQESDKVLAKYRISGPYIYNGGGLEVRKNTEGVLRAYKILVDNYASMFQIPQLVISGKMMPQLAPLVSDVAQLVEVLELTGKVKLLDFVPQEDLPALYKNATVFVFPSFYEGFGLPVLEALNQGVPVITSRRSSLEEVGGDAVLYCNPNDLDDLAGLMKKLLTDRELQKTLSEKAIKQAQKFSWDRFVKKMFNLIQAK